MAWVGSLQLEKAKPKPITKQTHLSFSEKGTIVVVNSPPPGARATPKRAREPPSTEALPRPEELDFGPHAVDVTSNVACWRSFLGQLRTAAACTVGLLLRERGAGQLFTSLVPLSPAQHKAVLAARRVARRFGKVSTPGQTGAGPAVQVRHGDEEGGGGELLTFEEEDSEAEIAKMEQDEIIEGVGLRLLGCPGSDLPSGMFFIRLAETSSSAAVAAAAVPQSSVRKLLCLLLTQAKSPALVFNCQGCALDSRHI